MTGQNLTQDFTKVSNMVVQYVDDSTNLISAANINEVNLYIDKYFHILECYYELNKLTLNSGKTKFLVICKPNLRPNTNTVQLNTANYTIEQTKKVKILGIYVTSGLCNNATINDIISKVNYRLNILKKVISYTDFRTTKRLFNSIIISVFKYGSPLLINSSTQSLHKLNTLLIKCARPI